MKIAALVASRNRPDLVERMVAQLSKPSAHEIDVYVVECGSELDNVSSHATLWYPDDEFKGKCYGHNLLLEQARQTDAYDYYWVLMNDVFFDEGVDAAAVLVEQMEREERMAILSPTNADGGYPGADRRPGGEWRAVTTCDYLGFMLRAEAAHEVGFLDAGFAYCWGAIHELAFKLYSAGWFVAYSDRLAYRHLGGSTYGVKGTRTISREEYQRRAKRYAYDHLRETYGEEWDARFFAATRGHQIEVDTFAQHREYWLSGFDGPEIEQRRQSRELARARSGRDWAARMLPRDEAGQVRLHLGAGRDKREGWINVDTNPACEPDVCAQVDDLSMFETASVDLIEANHLFEHLTFDQAVNAVAEWRRVLRPGGELFLELPDLERCIALLGQHHDDLGHDLAMVGLYGWPPDIARDGEPQQHKWGWSQASLTALLQQQGFGEVEFGPITQDWRPAARIGRDMRVRAAVASADKVATPPTPTVDVQTVEAVVDASSLPPIVLAWPQWDRPAELHHLFTAFGPELMAHPEARLTLFCHARECDRATATQALERAFTATLGAGADLDVELIEGPLSPEHHRQLCAATRAVVDLPSLARRGPEALPGIKAPLVSSAADLRVALGARVEPEPAAALPSATGGLRLLQTSTRRG
ncbi:methyltransferase domain-containing protein [Engelhardtia mirabilis]|uniref:Methyltransferase domain protein n=1 Tax=Engelhardtia mirabilis TaxID=2528011 RepID=A0A518BFN5_9BACT|nr:Methyltransferase domain protein [Planctomycetes bacterium Pla133]QDV00123.1 Methyltransferase domain protein [Planctomycetes bacterium Pla86]